MIVGAFVVLCGAIAAPALMAIMRGHRDPVAWVTAAPRTHVTTHGVDSTPQHEVRTLRIRDRNGSVHAAVRLPHEAPGPLAALVIAGGLRTGRNAIDLIDPELSCAVAALDYACEVPRAPGAWDIARVPELQRDLLRTAVALRDLVEYLRADPRVDPDRVFIVGASLGAPLASAVAATVIPSGLVFVHGFADHARLVEHQLAASIESAPARWIVARIAAWLTDGFDVRHTLPRLRDVPVLVVESTDDEMVPAACRRALWIATPEPRERTVVTGGHLRGSQRSAVLGAAIERTRSWLVRRGVSELAL